MKPAPVCLPGPARPRCKPRGRGRALAGFALGVCCCIALQSAAHPKDVHEELKGKFAMSFRVMDKELRRDAAAARRGEQLIVLIKVTGCSPGPAGNCDVDGDVSLRDPGGKSVKLLASHPLWTKEAPPSGELATALVMGMTFTTEDALGAYKVQTVVRDKVSGMMLERACDLEVQGK